MSAVAAVSLPLSSGAGHAWAQAKASDIYYCPMHPHYTSDRPGKCPICGMDLVKKETAAPASGTASAPASGVSITPERQQLIGVRTAVVSKRNLIVPLRISARVVLDKELYDAQTDYLGSNLTNSSYWNSSHQKLLWLGMGDQEIEELKSKRWADKTLLFIGVKDTAWVYGALYEQDMLLVKPGNKVELTTIGDPQETFEGVVTGVAKRVDPQGRTVRVRIKVQDPQRQLHPDMFLAARIKVDLGTRLAVPTEAVIDSGLRKIVYVVKGERFEPREVTLGSQAGDHFEVKGGLNEGETVVASGNFFVDAESKLKGAL